ncbi:hypothetical protein KEM56_001502, partial [Ascosphaera pollenicola]
MNSKATLLLICLLQLTVLWASARSLWKPDTGSANVTVAPAKRTEDESQQASKKQQFAEDQVKYVVLSNRERGSSRDQAGALNDDEAKRTSKEKEDFASKQAAHAVLSGRKRDASNEQEKP